ncbi:MAG: hypothetical protein VW405_01600 [Rhodospirillaceae bacterium]
MKKINLFLCAAFVAGAALLAFGGWPPEAHALSAPLGDLQGGGSGDQVTCATTATAIAPKTFQGVRPKSMTVQNTSATAVFVGGSSVDTTGGAEVCDGCAFGQTFAFDGGRAWCIVASGTQAVSVVWGY